MPGLMGIHLTAKIHDSAVIDRGATVGANSRIWHWSHICEGAHIGKMCSIGQNVFIGNNVKIGNSVKIQNNVSVYEKVVLEDNVFCGPSVVFTNVMNPRAEICRKNEYKPTLIRHGATLGANSTIICGVCVGKYAFIGAGAVVTKDIKDYALMVGLPARQVGWMSAYGEKVELPQNGDGSWVCQHTKDVYELVGSQLIRKPNIKQP